MSAQLADDQLSLPFNHELDAILAENRSLRQAVSRYRNLWLESKRALEQHRIGAMPDPRVTHRPPGSNVTTLWESLFRQHLREVGHRIILDKSVVTKFPHMSFKRSAQAAGIRIRTNKLADGSYRLTRTE